MKHRIRYVLPLGFAVPLLLGNQNGREPPTGDDLSSENRPLETDTSAPGNQSTAIPEDMYQEVSQGPADDVPTESSDELLPQAAVSQRNAQSGRWGGDITFPIIPLHSVLLPNGKVFSFGTHKDGTQGAQFDYNIWTPGGGHQTLFNSTNTDIFCAATGILPNGDVLIPGGDTRNPVNAGIKDTLIYRTGSQTLERSAYMGFARWYPTVTTLPNGEQFVHGGRDGGFVPVQAPEVWANGNWRTVWGASNGNIINDGEGKWFYPRNWVAPNGRIFGMTGNVMYFLDWGGNGGNQIAGNLPNKTRSHTSTAVMYQPGKILQVGGSTNGDTQARGSNQAIMVDINSGWPQVTHLPNMGFARVWANSTVLPNGEVFISGGSAYENKLQEVVYTAEMWNPNTRAFRQLSNDNKARLYHSISLLLPDASVLVAGGGAPGPQTNLNGQIFYPPYLFDGGGNFAARLAIGAMGNAFGYNATAAVPFSGAGGVSRVTLVRLGAVTHSFDMNQRFLELGFSVSGNTANVRLPNSANIAPPGHYMLFLINGAGVPSKAKILSLGGGAPPPPPPPPPPPGGPQVNGIYTLVARHSNKCADVAGAGVPNGTNVQQWGCNGTNAQKFRVISGANGAYRLQNVNSGRCVDVAERSAADGANIHQWDCHLDPNQGVRFAPGSNGAYTIKFDHSGKCMDVSNVGTGDGQNIHQWQCVGGAGNQEWFFRP